MRKAAACLRASCRGLASTAPLTRSIFSNFRADHGQPVDFCFIVKPVDLKLVIQTIMVLRSDDFAKPVDVAAFPYYRDFIVKPMDLTQLRQNIRAKMYGSTEAFLADAKWIVHNSIIFNSVQSKFTNTARALLKICKQEMQEIENCPDCYQNAHTRSSDSWFIEACRRPHVLVWAKLKGFPFWPAKAMTVNNENMVDVRFFGAHDSNGTPHLIARYCILENSAVKVFVQMEHGPAEARPLRDKLGSSVIRNGLRQVLTTREKIKPLLLLHKAASCETRLLLQKSTRIASRLEVLSDRYLTTSSPERLRWYTDCSGF
ncbi:hypothetical protein J6590_065148 [Homalodisca vitripennis]|nr:hypothetical protein J6590_065148 [Homalodisca vitripennis]